MKSMEKSALFAPAKQSGRQQTTFNLPTLFLIISLVVLISTPTMADTVYTYSGQQMHFGGYFGVNNPMGISITALNVSGSFTMASPLGANFSYNTISPGSYSFTGGGIELTNANSEIIQFKVSTDGTGNIVPNWYIDLFNINLNRFDLSTSKTGDSLQQGDVLVDPFLCWSAVNDAPGTWTMSSTPGPPAVPEPCTMLLLGSGLAGLAVCRRRLKRS